MDNLVAFGLSFGLAVLGLVGYYVMDHLYVWLRAFITDIREFRRFKKERDYWLDHELSVEEFVREHYYQ